MVETNSRSMSYCCALDISALTLHDLTAKCFH